MLYYLLNRCVNTAVIIRYGEVGGVLLGHVNVDLVVGTNLATRLVLGRHIVCHTKSTMGGRRLNGGGSLNYV